jgi:hypothetical protein
MRSGLSGLDEFSIMDGGFLVDITGKRDRRYRRFHDEAQ